MKKKLLFLFALICSVSIFSSCGDDDKDTTWTQIPDATKENTKLTINGGTLPDATASLDIQSAEAAVLKLTNAIYGHDDISVNVAMVKSNDSTYVFEGTANLDGAISKATAAVDKGLTVAAKGTVTTSGKLTVEVTTSGWGTLSGVYSGDSLKMTTNGTENNRYPVTVTTTSESKATLVFDKIPNVANDFTMEVTLAKDGEGYKIEGTVEKEAGYNVTVSGNVSKNVLTLAITTSGYATLSKTYYSPQLVCTYNDELKNSENWAGSAKLAFTSDKKLDITLNSIVSGLFTQSNQGEVNLKDVDYTVTDGTYTFSGSVNPEGFKASTVSVEGSVNPEGIFTLNVTHTISSGIVGKWNMAKTPQGLGKTYFDFQSASNLVEIPDALYQLIPADMQAQIPAKMNDEAFKNLVAQLLGQYTIYLKSIEFKANTNVAIVYSKMGEEATGKEYTLEGYMNFSINDKGKLIITPNLEVLLKMIMPTANSVKTTSTKAYDPFEGMELLSGGGVPMNFELSGNELRVSVDNGVFKGIGTMVEGLLPLIGMFLPDPALAEKINAIFTPVNAFIQNTPTLEVGLYLNK